MTQRGKSVNARQTAYLLFAVITVYKIINLPQALVQGAGRDAWLGSAVLMLWEAVLVAVLYAIMRLSPSRTVERILSAVLGSVGMRITVGLFGAFLIFKLYLGFLTTEQYLMSNLYDRISWIPFGLPMLLTVAYAAVKGVRSIGRMGELIGVVLLVFMAVGVVSIVGQADFGMLRPVLHEGVGPLARVTESSLIGTSEAIVFVMLVGRAETEKLGRNLLWGMFASSVVVILFNACFYGFYAEVGVNLKHGQAISDMLQYMRGSDSLARLDIFIVVAILLLSLMKMMVYAWAAGQCFRVAFGLERHKKGALLAQLPTVATLTLFEYLLQKDIFNIYHVMRDGWKYIMIVPFEIVFPILILVCVLVLRVRDKKENHGLRIGVYKGGTLVGRLE